MKYDTHNGNMKVQYPFNMQYYKITNMNSTNPDNNQVVSKKWITEHVTSQAQDLSPYLKKDGIINMSGNLNLNNNKITNIADPRSNNNDAMSYKFFETHFFKSMWGDINCNGKRFFNIGSNTNRDQLINRQYVEDHCYKRDGSYSLSGNMNCDNNKIGNLKGGTSNKDAINKQQ